MAQVCGLSAEELSASFMNVNTTPLGGMQAAQAQIERSAARIASFPAAGAGADSVDLSAEMISLLEARNNFAADVKAQEVMDETAQNTLSLVG